MSGPRRLGDAASDGRFSFSVDGEPVDARAGETVAAAMLAAGRRTIRRTARRDEPRGLYCVMGVCWECAVLIDGRIVRACVVPAVPGLAVETLGERR